MKKNICVFIVLLFLFFIFNSIWFEFCFQIIPNVISLHIWILKYILLKFTLWFMQLVDITDPEFLSINMLTHQIKNKLV
jgi:hypothetical protein